MLNRIVAAFLAFLIISSPAALADYKSRSVDFGGDGRLNNVAISSNTTETTVSVRNYVAFTVNNGITYTVKHGSIINTVADVVINGVLQVVGGFPGGIGGLGRIATNGSGPGGGYVRFDSKRGAGGGGNGGNGGNGGSSTSGSSSSNGGRGIGTSCWSYGGGGAAGQADSQSDLGNNGGDGAGSVRIFANKSISIPSGGIIRANGSNGVTGSNNTTGSGAGAGGQIQLFSRVSIVNNGTIEAKGGVGGNGVGGDNPGGGGGGAGVVTLFAPLVTAGTVTLTGGAPGTGETQQTSGGAGQLVEIHDYPTIPVIGELNMRMSEVCDMARANGGHIVITDIKKFLLDLPIADNFQNSRECSPVAILNRRRTYAHAA